MTTMQTISDRVEVMGRAEILTGSLRHRTEIVLYDLGQ